MLSSEFKLLLEQVADKRNTAKMLNEQLLVVNTERNLLQGQLLEILIKNFTGSKEELLYMLDARNDTTKMHIFRDSYLRNKGLHTVGMYPEAEQVGLGILFDRSSDADYLKLSAKGIKDIFPLIRPVKVNLVDDTTHHSMLIDTVNIDDDEKIVDNIYLIEKDGKYCIRTFNKYSPEIFAEWSEDLEWVLTKARESIISFLDKPE